MKTRLWSNMAWKGTTTVVRASKNQLRISIPASIVIDEAFKKSKIKESSRVQVIFVPNKDVLEIRPLK